MNRIDFYDELTDIMIEIQQLYCFVVESQSSKLPEGYEIAIDPIIDRLNEKISRYQLLRTESDE